MDDTISRRAAIEALEKGKDKKAKGDIGGFYNKIIQNDIDKIKALPPAQHEAKTNANGDWMILNKDKILKAGMEGREVDFRIGGRLFAIREKAQ